MEESGALMTIMSSIQAIGKGFDVNCDTRLLYCKGGTGSRIVRVDDEQRRDVPLSNGVVLPDVPRDLQCSVEAGGRISYGACSFYEMAEFFSKRADLPENIVVGSFNSAFSFTGSKKSDALATKSLAIDGKFIPLCKIHLDKHPLALEEDVRVSVPRAWEPLALARFIETYGTHVITSVTIGGKDVVYVKQHSSSPLSIKEIKNYIHDIGDQRFSESEIHKNSGPLKLKDKAVDPFTFSSQGIYPQPLNAPYLSAKEDVTVIFRRRGGDDVIQSYFDWAKTVFSAPDVIEMTFLPITSLLGKFPGNEHLTRAINLYLEHKPPIEELRYFLEFQIPRLWAPVRDEFPGRTRKEPVCPSLKFSLLSEKLFVSEEQVSVGRKPVTGLRLCLEGAKQDRLCIHVQHLRNLPKILQPLWDLHVAIGAPQWLGPEEQDSRWFQPVKSKNYSHISTAPIEFNQTTIADISGVHIVTGAQLGVWSFGSKVLYMKLLYSKVPGCTVRRSLWDHSPKTLTGKLKRLPSADSMSSSDSSSGLGDDEKLMKLVDSTEMVKGPDDIPGHWIVTGAKLGVDRGKIVLRLKYSLLSY